MEQNRVVALLLHYENKRVLTRHEATKLKPRCLVDVDYDDNGELIMKKILLGAVASIVLAAPALAADLPARPYTKAPVYKAPEVIYNWTGFYLGGHLGGAFPGGSSLDTTDARFMGGVQGGFDYQFSNTG